MKLIAVLLVSGFALVAGDTRCIRAGGTCKYTSQGCAGGGFRAGMCNGPANRQCCIRSGGSGDSRCTAAGGSCRLTSQGCPGGGFRSGLCSGPANRQCCVRGSTGGNIVRPNCMRCICRNEGCEGQIGKCRMDVGSLSCGPYQIKQGYWTDCGRPGSSWRGCTTQMACSERCVQAYMRRYGRRCTGGRTPGCRDFSMIHNGGPSGCRKNLIRYWNRIQRCCASLGGNCG